MISKINLTSIIKVVVNRLILMFNTYLLWVKENTHTYTHIYTIWKRYTKKKRYYISIKSLLENQKKY